MKSQKKDKRKKHRSRLFTLTINFCLCILVVFSGNLIINYKAAKPYEQMNFNKGLSGNNISVSNIASDDDSFLDLPLINDNRGVPVICYHSIGDDPTGKSPIIISKEKFREHLQTIKDNGYTTLTIGQLNNYLFMNKPIPEKSVVLTFDDGYVDNYTNAFPILKEFKMNATIFIISSYLDGVTYMSPSQVKEMSDYGIDIESHTVTHRKLSTLSYEDQLKELKDSKESLETLIGKPIVSIAYPEGQYNEDTKKAVLDAGYSMGFTIDRGYADRDDNRAELNRICVDYTYKPRNIVKILRNLPK